MPATRIALRAFENLSGDPSQDVLAKGLGLDLATELARFSTVEVIPPTAPRASAAPARDDSTSLFVLAGGVRRFERRIRITAQLTDATSGRQVWAERYDAEEDKIVAVQDEIVAQVAAALALKSDTARLALAPEAGRESGRRSLRIGARRQGGAAEPRIRGLVHSSHRFVAVRVGSVR